MYKVLIVDDEPLFRYYMRTKLDWSSHGFTICGEAANGAEALEEAKRWRPDLALVDISMPYLNGIELTEKLNTNLPGIIVVFVTGHNEFEYAQMALRLGVFDYLLKPFDQREFAAVLTKVKNKLELGKKEEAFFRQATGSPLLRDEADASEGKPDRSGLFAEPSHPHDRHKDAVSYELHPGAHELLLSALKMRDPEAARVEIRRTVALFRPHRTGGRFAFTVLMGYVSLCLSYASKTGMNPESLWKPAASAEDYLRQMTSWEEVEEWLIGLYQKVIEYKEDRRPSKSYNLYLAAKRYIHQHYSDPELTVDQVAGGMFVDASYLRKVFRKEGDISVLDYITYTRMRRAKELLAEGNVKLADIAEKVGYTDPSYFGKSFKKYYGMPPSEFEQREIRIRNARR
ncbi:response regulator transcription factor [Paenibacillus sp. A14]|uniref:response regulator transcription factor n=1 Tax=Paenibacillus sp. A14 TaxID=3119820 RepID=UPI002FE19A3D